jgi:Coenzyme PQQ synthesis protein D (PqqD)
MNLDFNQHIAVPDDVLMRELDGESVLLNLATDSYFGLDTVGTDMWRALTGAGSIEEAYRALLAGYDVEPDVLRRDMEELIEKLVDSGLLTIDD